MDKENMFLNELNCNFFNPNWENDQNDPFESALSLMVSSPIASSNCVEKNPKNNNELRELIGKLGTICRNSPNQHYIINSTNTSCYNTPLNSPPKLNLSIMENNQQTKGVNLQIHENPFPPFSTDQGLAEKAARFSCFANKGSLIGLNAQLGLSEMENSSLSEQITIGEIALKSRKRKSIAKGKQKEIPASSPAKDTNVESENSELSAKRSKSDNVNEKVSENSIEHTNQKNNLKPQEPLKDYIHLRARRGQATDAHSLAERVRREKIGERMKFLQDLVPGCNKITGKAVMLDEIINYVQSLQRQVEFLSMKLATVDVDSRPDFMEALMFKDIFQSQGSLSHMYSSDCYSFQSSQNLHTAIPNGTDETFSANHFNVALTRNQLPPMDSFIKTASHVSTFWENDLHSIVQMGYDQNQTQDFHGNNPTVQMKVEL